MRYRVVRAITVCSVILLLSSTAVQAQSVSTAQIDGTVKDGGVTRTAITNDTGSYITTNLPELRIDFDGERSAPYPARAVRLGSSHCEELAW